MLKIILSPKDVDRFWSKVAIAGPDECWEWLAFRKRRGYGQFTIRHHGYIAHRVAWVATYGPIPVGMCVCHRCDNPPCCNPDHLFLATQAENNHDMIAKGRDHLWRGQGMKFEGQQNGRSKLTTDEVVVIRESFAAGQNRTSLAIAFGVHKRTIDRIVSRRRWKNVP